MNLPSFACVVEDSTGALYQYVPLGEVILTDPGMPGRELPVRRSRIGGWSDLRCRPIDGRTVVPPVRVVWRSPDEASSGDAGATKLQIQR